jgi:hypothetical protein
MWLDLGFPNAFILVGTLVTMQTTLLSFKPKSLRSLLWFAKKLFSYSSNQGMAVILDLHWSDQGNSGGSCGQQTMADSNSITFWTQVRIEPASSDLPGSYQIQ